MAFGMLPDAGEKSILFLPILHSQNTAVANKKQKLAEEEKKVRLGRDKVDGIQMGHSVIFAFRLFPLSP